LDGNATPWPQQSLTWEEAARSLPNDHTPGGLEARQFVFDSPRIRIRPEFAAYAFRSFTPRRPMPEALLDLTARIHNDFRFDSKVTNVRTPTEEVFRKRRGVCQDFAHLQIACLRSLNLAARYVSGVRESAGLTWIPQQPCPLGWPRDARAGPGLRRHQPSARPNSRQWSSYTQSRR
jgi:transglutaminase-like putative cysteine protease